MSYYSLVLAGVLMFGVTVSHAGAPPKVTPELLEKGKQVYTVNCLTCHGEKGDGNGPAGALMNPKPRSFLKDKLKVGGKPEQLFKTVSSGLPNTAMAAFAHLPEEDRWAAVLYVKETFLKKK